jgi:AraC family transcriptional regulator
MSNRNNYADVNETFSCQVPSLPGIGDGSTTCVPGGLPGVVSTRAGDGPSPARFLRDFSLKTHANETTDFGQDWTVLHVSPEDSARRKRALWTGLSGEIVQITQPSLLEYRYRAPAHLLVAIERGERYEGETLVEGLPRSSRRSMGQKLTLVPAGRRFHEWQDPRIRPRLTCLYLDPHCAMAEDGPDLSEIELAPRLFFYDADIWATVRKLARLIERSSEADRLYAEALGLLLMRELLRLSHGLPHGETARSGGLADWQATRTAEYIEAHLGEGISLGDLAAIARLSPYHFVRAFKRSFGVPPHRYHTARRIERAKTLLAQSRLSITEIALEVGFGQASSFGEAFRQLVGRTPRRYRRSTS